VARLNFDKMILVALTALCAALMGLTGMAPASAATLQPPGWGDSHPLFQVEPGETFSQQLVVPVNTNEIHLKGQGLGIPSIRGFRAPILDTGTGAMVLYSVTPKGVPTNGNYRVLVRASQKPGRYNLEFRSCVPGKPGWRSNIWYEVTDDLVGLEPEPAKDGQKKENCLIPATPRFGGEAPPFRFSGQLNTARTLGQEPPGDVAVDHGFGRGTIAVQIAPNTDLRIGLAGGMARPAKDGSPHGWGEFIGPELSLARQVGEYRINGGFRWMADSSFGTGWTNTPVALVGGVDTLDWAAGGWLRPEAEASLSPRHLGVTGKATVRITPHTWPAYLGIFGGAMGAANLEKGGSWGRGMVGLSAGLTTALGDLDLYGGVGFAPNCPTIAVAGVAIR